MDTDRLLLGWRIDVRREGISETYGITLSSLRSLGTSLYSLKTVVSCKSYAIGRCTAWLVSIVTLQTYEACLKNLLGKFNPRLSTTRNMGGSNFNRVGFMNSLHAKITTTPTMILNAAFGHPMSANRNGAVAGTG